MNMFEIPQFHLTHLLCAYSACILVRTPHKIAEDFGLSETHATITKIMWKMSTS